MAIAIKMEGFNFVVTGLPEDQAEKVVDALEEAGVGRIWQSWDGSEAEYSALVSRVIWDGSEAEYSALVSRVIAGDVASACAPIIAHLEGIGLSLDWEQPFLEPGDDGDEYFVSVDAYDDLPDAVAEKASAYWDGIKDSIADIEDATKRLIDLLKAQELDSAEALAHEIFYHACELLVDAPEYRGIEERIALIRLLKEAFA
ncbi:hypothetical protein [Sinimarinibacterium sp. NLF-5-8]|uniref:hypothetical protein n=1 Tax=Sinimarinibacterium sp. NLF-5-8 TaxID=2698684 RepID=UPI00137BBA87|nr:hypothetical protein [Sinimarinibacterium sp. NLF-5-8]QHS09155.1 hypothetical protein GT972_02615 [Sinimarinibacterium sp. NLF-5-8]